jgi:uncharacterized membrane protein YqjE
MTDRSRLERGEAPRGLLDSLRALFATLIAIGHNRLELFSTEAKEEIERVVSIVLWAVIAVMLAAIGVAMVAVTIVLAVGGEYRVLTTGMLAALFVVCAVAALLVARARALSKPRLFDATLTELAKDHDQLKP